MFLLKSVSGDLFSSNTPAAYISKVWYEKEMIWHKFYIYSTKIQDLFEISNSSLRYKIL